MVKPNEPAERDLDIVEDLERYALTTYGREILSVKLGPDLPERVYMDGTSLTIKPKRVITSITMREDEWRRMGRDAAAAFLSRYA